MCHVPRATNAKAGKVTRQGLHRSIIPRALSKKELQISISTGQGIVSLSVLTRRRRRFPVAAAESHHLNPPDPRLSYS